MKFLDPKNDYAFKRIFGSDQSHDILKSFLNAILYQEQEIITDLVIINPHNLGTTYTLKDTFLDVKAKLNNNTTVLIEMQSGPHPLTHSPTGEGEKFVPCDEWNICQRVIYHTMKKNANQLDIGEKYFLLNPVIAVTITNFTLFKNTAEIINSFVLKEEKQNFNYPEEIKLVFVELPKFNKTLEDLNNLVEKWIFFLKNAEHFTEKHPILAENNVLNKALEISNLATVSIEELEEIQTRQMWLVDQETITRYAKEIGREEGIKEGIEQGIEQGVGQGVEKATKEMINRLIKRQLGEISPEIKKRIDQLSLDKIRILEEELFNFQNQDNLINWLDSH